MYVPIIMIAMALTMALLSYQFHQHIKDTEKKINTLKYRMISNTYDIKELERKIK